MLFQTPDKLPEVTGISEFTSTEFCTLSINFKKYGSHGKTVKRRHFWLNVRKKILHSKSLAAEPMAQKSRAAYLTLVLLK